MHTSTLFNDVSGSFQVNYPQLQGEINSNKNTTNITMNADSSSPPPWQVLELVAHRLDPQTLAAAACVSKSWWVSMSSDHLWHPFCSAAYPSLSSLHAHAAVSYFKLFSLGRAADERRLRKPAEPRIRMRDLIFAIDVVQCIDGRSSRVATVVKPGASMNPDGSGVFRFDIDVGGEREVVVEGVDSIRVTWNVVVEDFKGVFTMMECKGKGSFLMGLDGWFSKELPAGCGGGSGMVADLRMGVREEGGRVVVEKISVGVLSVLSWKYVCVDDALRYLQYFLLSN